MANTNTPVASSHQHRRLRIDSGDFGVTIPRTASQGNSGCTYFNCYPRTHKQIGKDPIRSVYKRPGAAPQTVYTPAYNNTVINEDLLRGGYFFQDVPSSSSNPGVLFSVVGNELFVNNTKISTAFTETLYVGCTLANIAGSPKIAILEGSYTTPKIWEYTYGTPGTLTGPTSITGTTGITGNPVFLNGRIYVAGYNSQRIYNSAVGTISSFTTANDFIDAEMEGDSIAFIAKHKNHLVAFGTSSIEFFYDAGIEIGSPLQRQESYASSIGALTNAESSKAPQMCQVGDTIYFAGVDDGVVGIYRIKDFRVTKVSSPFIDMTLNTVNSPENYIYRSHFRMFIFNLDGEPVVMMQVISNRGNEFSDRLFCYIPSEDTWVEWSKIGFGDDSPIFFRPLYAWCSNLQTAHNFVLGYGNSTGNGAQIVKLSNTRASTDPATSQSIEAIITFPEFDDNNAYQKHMKSVDIIGDYQFNTVALEYQKDTDVATTYLAQDSVGLPVRFRNLGRGRKWNLKVKFTGAGPINFSGIDLSYNQGTH